MIKNAFLSKYKDNNKQIAYRQMINNKQAIIKM